MKGSRETGNRAGPLRAPQLNAIRVTLSILGGVFVIGIIENLLAVIMLLRYGLAGSQPASAVHVAVMYTGIMFVAATLGALASLSAALARDAWSPRWRWFLPILVLVLVIYAVLYLLGLFADASQFDGELLVEKRHSIGIFMVLSVLGTLIGVWHYRGPQR